MSLPSTNRTIRADLVMSVARVYHKSRFVALRAAFVKVCGCRPHDGGAAHSGAGVRKPPREETAGRRARWRVRYYGDFVAGGVRARFVERVLRARSSRLAGLVG